jgi:hypothetical protein
MWMSQAWWRAVSKLSCVVTGGKYSGGKRLLLLL